MTQSYTEMAIVYDFDGTLTPGNIQEHQFIPDIGMNKGDFWKEVKRRVQAHSADEILMYMMLMLDKAKEANIPVRRENFELQGRDIEFFEGVDDWFERINSYGHNRDIKIKHFIISSANYEIISGTKIFPNFENVYASKFLFDPNDVAIWPAFAMNYTNKTQFLFRINKGDDDLSERSKINKYVPMQDRPIPFENIIYIGDGDTDVPCFRLVKDLGGLSIAVYKHRGKGAKTKAEKFFNDGRVFCIAQANYTENSNLDQIVKSQIDLVSAKAKKLQVAIRPRVSLR